MAYDKEYWEVMIGILLLFFATYTVMKDLITDSESTTKAFFLAVVFDILFILFFTLFQKRIKHEIKS